MSSFEKLRPTAAVPPSGGVPVGAFGRVTLGARADGASLFRDFDGGAGTATPSEEPVDATPESAAPTEARQAADAAYADGFDAGRAAATAELVRDGDALVKAMQELERFRASLLERYQGELLALALGIARKVVQRELAEHPEHWLGMIREAVRHALDREKIRIRVGAVLHKFLLEHLSTLRPMLDEVKELELVEDQTLSENGCILESQFGDLDLGIDSQIGAIRAALTQGV
jgi:flagellar assembly protein FliH